MKNQRSWRLLSEMQSTDTEILVSKVIWKKDEDWNSFYPLFDEPTTVVFMSEDRKTFETCKATADWQWNMILTKRWLSDDKSGEEIESFKLERLPWTYMFATMWASDLPSLNEWNTWTWNQVFNGDINISWELNITWDFVIDTEWKIDLEADGDVSVGSNNWTTTFRDKNVWPITLSQMIKPPAWWSAIEIMSEADFEQIDEPELNTAYFRFYN